MSPTESLDKKIILALTLAVIWVGTVKVLGSGEAPAAAPPAPDPGAEGVDPAAAPVADPSPASDPAPETPAVEIGTPAEAGWTMGYEAELGSPMKLAFTELWETDAAGEQRPYKGKLTLHYGDGMTEAYPIVDGAVSVEPRPMFRQKMIETKRLGVEFKGHEVVEHELKWIIMGVR